MTTPHRNFVDDAVPLPDGEFQPRPGPTFDLGGRGQLTGEMWSETFHCLAEAPAVALDDMAASVVVDQRTGEYMLNGVSIQRFFEQVLVPEDTDRFRKLCREKDRTVKLSKLFDVLDWLSDYYAERPTQPLSASSRGAMNGGHS